MDESDGEGRGGGRGDGGRGGGDGGADMRNYIRTTNEPSPCNFSYFEGPQMIIVVF